MAQIIVNFWAGARAAAGTAEMVLRADSVRSALDLAAERAPDHRLRNVIAASSIMRDGRVLSSTEYDQTLDDDPATDRIELDVLPPFAGGSSQHMNINITM